MAFLRCSFLLCPCGLIILLSSGFLLNVEVGDSTSQEAEIYLAMEGSGENVSGEHTYVPRVLCSPFHVLRLINPNPNPLGEQRGT